MVTKTPSRLATQALWEGKTTGAKTGRFQPSLGGRFDPRRGGRFQPTRPAAFSRFLQLGDNNCLRAYRFVSTTVHGGELVALGLPTGCFTSWWVNEVKRVAR